LDLQAFQIATIPQSCAMHALELWLFSGVMLLPDQLANTGVIVVSLFTDTVRFASLCVIVLHYVIK
jgi:hypothetical protein